MQNQDLVAPPSLQNEEATLIVIGETATMLPDGRYSRYATWDEFTQSGIKPLCFFLAAHDVQQQQNLAQAIRRSAYWDLPVFVREHDTACDLVDGCTTPEAALREGERVAALKRNLSLRVEELNYDERILYWLYLREPGELKPVQDRNAKRLYRYPVAESLARDHQDTHAALAGLMDRRLLEPAALIDRTRHCPECEAAHLHYLDVCSHCASIAVHKQPSLHCFTCGYVGAQNQFETEAGTICPKCSVRLRHIGVDYDRPLTQYICADCGTASLETAVTARCLYCNSANKPDALQVRQVSALRLSAHGRATLRAGQLAESLAALDVVNYVVPKYFRFLVDWALMTQRRHNELQFGLLLIEFENAREVVEAHGAQRAYLMLDEFANRLHELLRNSDLSTRTAEERLWLFLPFSSPAGLAARVEAFFNQQTSDQGTALRASVRYLRAPEDVRRDDCAEDLMSRLAQEVVR